MELRDYLKILAKHKLLIGGITVLAVAAVLALKIGRPVEYQGSITLLVLNKTEVTNEYKYDSFYNVRAASSLAKTIESWFHSPDNVVNIYKQAHAQLPTTNFKKLQNLFDIKRFNTDSSLVSLHLTGTNQLDIQNVLNQAGKKADNKLKDLQDKQVLGGNFYLDIEGPTLLPQKEGYIFDLVIALIAGLMLGGIISFVKEYFSS